VLTLHRGELARYGLTEPGRAGQTHSAGVAADDGQACRMARATDTMRDVAWEGFAGATEYGA
jgi:hypothetical protein